MKILAPSLITVLSIVSGNFSKTQGGQPRLEGMDTKGDGDRACWYCGVVRDGWGSETPLADLFSGGLKGGRDGQKL